MNLNPQQSNQPIDLELDLQSYKDTLKIRQYLSKTQIWDPVRKAYFVLQPEEMVRQLLIACLIQRFEWPATLISVEKQFTVGNRKKRYDLLLFNSANEATVLIETKEPAISLDQKSFDQIAEYNLSLKIPYLMITNGLIAYLAHIDFEKKKYTFINHLPGLENTIQ